MSNALVPGSIAAIALQSGKSIAESFVNADCIVIVDTSGSMASHDSRGGRSRYDVACEELKNLQNSLPGKIAVLSFSTTVEFCPSGVPFDFGGGTDMSKALKFAKMADVPDMSFIVISDGEPDDPNETLTIARSFKSKISTIYVGPENQPLGRDFLNRLAQASGGQSITVDRAKELASGIRYLLNA